MMCCFGLPLLCSWSCYKNQRCKQLPAAMMLAVIVVLCV